MMYRKILALTSGLAAMAMPATMAWADAGADKTEARELFRQVIEIPTVEGRGEVPRLAALLADRFKAEGFADIEILPYRDSANLVLRWKAERKNDRKPMLLMAHMDVVEAKREDWVEDPFIFREKDGYYWGRGSIDNKAGLLAITMTLIQLKREGFKPGRDIIVLFTGDEETAGDGARLASTEWRPKIEAEFALNTDAGGGGFTADGRSLGYGLQSAEKTYRSYSFTARNRGGHSSRPRDDNAIYALSAALGRLATHRFTPMLNETTRGYFTARAEQESGPLGDAMRRWIADENDGEAADFIENDEKEVGLTRTRCVATRLQGGHADNALPQMAQAIVNCRIMPGVDPENVKAELAAIAGPDVSVDQSDSFGDAAAASPLRPDVVSAYTKAVRKHFPEMRIIPQMSAGATDGVFTRGIGIPTYGVGGEWIIVPDDERTHGLDERIPVKAFYDNIDIWHDMVRELAK